jgi:hypothetical protein
MTLQRYFFSTRANSIAWLALMVATGISWWIGRAAQSADGDVNAAVAGIIISAAVKVWIVGFQFMEIKTAPKVLQYVFSAWLIGVSSALVIICIG